MPDRTFDHSGRSLEDLLRQGLQARLIERYEKRRRAFVLTVDGYAVTLSPLQAHRFLCGMLWSTRAA